MTPTDSLPPPPPPGGGGRPDPPGSGGSEPRPDGPGSADDAAAAGPGGVSAGSVPPPQGRPVRRSGDRVVAGVAAGLGRHFGIDPVLVRILFVITTFAAGLGALAYLILWVVLPLVEGPAPAHAGEASRGIGFWVGAAVVTLGGVIALSDLPAPRLLVPLALVAIGAALWQRPSSSAGPPTTGPGPDTPAASTTASGASAGVGSARSSATSAGTSPASSAGAPGRPATATGDSSVQEHRPDIRWWIPPEPRSAPSWLGPITIAVALLATGIVGALGAGGVAAVSGSDLVAVALLVLAGGLLVGTVWGRAKWLALPAFSLAGILVGMQLVGAYGVQLSPEIGADYVSAARVGDVTVRHGIGSVEVDLVDAEVVPGGSVDVDLGVGEAVIIVPDDVTVQLTGAIGIGSVEWHVASGTDPGSGEPTVVERRIAGGRDLRFDATLESADPDAPVLRIDVAAGIGVVDVYRGDIGGRIFDRDQAVREFPWDEPNHRDEAVARVLRETCPPGESDRDDMVQCWRSITPDGEVVDEVVDDPGATFFDEICLDPVLVTEASGEVRDCIVVLEDHGAEIRVPQEGN